MLRSIDWLWWRPPCLLRTVIVMFLDRDVPPVRGVLWSMRGGWLVLRNPEALKPADDTWHRVMGEIVIERARVAFLQVPP